jgi:hypothetical protein
VCVSGWSDFSVIVEFIAIYVIKIKLVTPVAQYFFFKNFVPTEFAFFLLILLVTKRGIQEDLQLYCGFLISPCSYANFGFKELKAILLVVYTLLDFFLVFFF